MIWSLKLKGKKIIRLDTVKDRISELEDRSREIIQNTSREIKRYKLWKGDRNHRGKNEKVH